MKIVYPDNELCELKAIIGTPRTSSIFLAGTIDNGDSEDWQQELIDKLENVEGQLGMWFTIFNPRRKTWKKNATKEDLEYQIKWEQDHLDEANLIIMNIADNSKSPITLLEMGLYATSGKLIVFCTDKFYRYDNVRLTCEKYMIPMVNSTKVTDIVKEIQKIYTI